MEALTLKLDKAMLKNIDTALPKHNFSTRTEFIREAIRDKLHRVSFLQAAALVKQYKGKGTTFTTDAALRKARALLD
ncbi:MAG: ribbon-helix-helix domain-containing protein [archaeon]